MTSRHRWMLAAALACASTSCGGDDQKAGASDLADDVRRTTGTSKSSGVLGGNQSPGEPGEPSAADCAKGVGTVADPRCEPARAPAPPPAR